VFLHEAEGLLGGEVAEDADGGVVRPVEGVVEFAELPIETFSMSERQPMVEWW
jgi:hypothetical protein